MRDILFTLASAGSHPAPLHVRVGEWERFVDVRGGVAVQCARVKGQLVGRVIVSRGDRVRTTLLLGTGLPGLHELLREASRVGTRASS
jgi:hypothetical protein